nr:MAG TPA: virion morphogenesis protein [Caudoviricetes sp.]
MKSETHRILKRILDDIRVEMTDEFDQNFERQSFFGEAWQRRKSPIRQGGHILVDTGRLRRSIQSRTTENSITFFTEEPYAAIHNEGGEIVVTERMKRYFRAKFYEAQQPFERKRQGDSSLPRKKLSDGGFYAWTSKMTMKSPEAEFWRFMALKKAGTTIKIPRRRFLGTSPEVEKAVREIIEENITEYINFEFEINEK